MFCSALFEDVNRRNVSQLHQIFKLISVIEKAWVVLPFNIKVGDVGRRDGVTSPWNLLPFSSVNFGRIIAIFGRIIA